MKTKEHFLRASFGEERIERGEPDFYPQSTQRPRIYLAMDEYAEEYAKAAICYVVENIGTNELDALKSFESFKESLKK